MLFIDFTICFAVASLFIVKSQYPDGLQINKYLFYRDSIVYLLTLALLAFFLRDNIIDYFEALILCCLWPIYMYISYKFKIYDKSKENLVGEYEERNILFGEGNLI